MNRLCLKFATNRRVSYFRHFRPIVPKKTRMVSIKKEDYKISDTTCILVTLSSLHIGLVLLESV